MRQNRDNLKFFETITRLVLAALVIVGIAQSFAGLV